MVAVFQDGIVGHAFGLAHSGVIESWVPIFVFAILFGLSMDYHVFILTRVKEARDRGLDSRAAVARGISITSGTITSAATIMVLVFAAFVTIPFAFIQELGLGLAVAVLLRRHDRAQRAAAGLDDPPRRLELVDAVVPALAAAGHDRGRARAGATVRGSAGSGGMTSARDTTRPPPAAQRLGAHPQRQTAGPARRLERQRQGVPALSA